MHPLRDLERKLTYKNDQILYSLPPSIVFEPPQFKSNPQGISTPLYIQNFGSKNWVLLCHGNKGNVTHPTYHAQYELLKRLQHSFVTFDYPGYGVAKGVPSEESLFAAGENAYNFCREEMKVPPSNLIVWGKSLGGGVAVELASKFPCRALILECAFTDSHAMGRYSVPVPLLYRLLPNRFRNLEKIGKISVPTLFFHGRRDLVIPPAMSEALFSRSGSNRKELFFVEDAGHANIIESNTELVFARLQSFLVSQLS